MHMVASSHQTASAMGFSWDRSWRCGPVRARFGAWQPFRAFAGSGSITFTNPVRVPDDRRPISPNNRQFHPHIQKIPEMVADTSSQMAEMDTTSFSDITPSSGHIMGELLGEEELAALNVENNADIIDIDGDVIDRFPRAQEVMMAACGSLGNHN